MLFVSLTHHGLVYEFPCPIFYVVGVLVYHLSYPITTTTASRFEGVCGV